MHVSEERLQRFADGELEGADRETVQRHTAGCAECRRLLEGIALADEAYGEYRKIAMANDPAPPRTWMDLRQEIRRMDAERTESRPWAWKPWLAAAATVAIAMVAYWRMFQPATVSASELLVKAAAAEPARDASRRIRVRTGKREWVRPATGATVESQTSDLEALFRGASFSWQDPLSARSFAQWRDGLAEKHDRVRVSAANYEIRTTTESNPLREAVLVLDARDLHAIRETLRFTNEEVEISEAPEAKAEAAPAGAAPRQAAPPTASAALGLEMRALAALHAIGADLGEPVQVVRRDGSVTVEATGLTAARERQVQEALATLPEVDARFGTPETSAMSATGKAPAAAAGHSELRALLGEAEADRMLDASEAMMARAHALRGLSRRFPADVEAQLSDADRRVLAGMRDDHIGALASEARAIGRGLARLLPKVETGAAAAAEDRSWQAQTDRLFAAAQRVDRLLNRVLAGSDELGSVAGELAESLRRLEAEVER